MVVIKVLWDACPDVMMMKDNKGYTPLHLGMKVRAPVEIINAPLDACPQAVTIEANDGETFLDCGLGGEKPVSLVSIQAFVDKCPYAIESMKMPFIPLHLANFFEVKKLQRLSKSQRTTRIQLQTMALQTSVTSSPRVARRRLS